MSATHVPAHAGTRSSLRLTGAPGRRRAARPTTARVRPGRRTLLAATSGVAVVSAVAVVVASALTGPADGAPEVRDVASSTAAAPPPAHAELGAAAAAVGVSAPSPAARVKAPLTIQQRYGIDLSWPQCGTTVPDLSLDFAVIGLTDGHAESVNPCFAEQVAWANANHLRTSVYVVPNSPGVAATAGMRSAAEPAPVNPSPTPTPCVSADAACPAYAAGVRQAQHALAAATAAQLPRTGWWLDVEETTQGTLWGADTTANAALLQGWVDTLRAAKLPVGVYSTHGYWMQITGGWQANLPQWVPVGLEGITSAQAACAEPFTTGPVVMTQWLTGPYDGNILCPSDAGDPMARAFTGHRWASATTPGVPALLTTPVPHPELEQAQAEQDAASECDTAGGDPSDDPSDDSSGQRNKKKGASSSTKDPKDSGADCGDDTSGKDPKEPKEPKGVSSKPKTKPKHHHKPKKHHHGGSNRDIGTTTKVQ